MISLFPLYAKKYKRCLFKVARLLLAHPVNLAHGVQQMLWSLNKRRAQRRVAADDWNVAALLLYRNPSAVDTAQSPTTTAKNVSSSPRDATKSRGLVSEEMRTLEEPDTARVNVNVTLKHTQYVCYSKSYFGTFPVMILVGYSTTQ